MADTSATTTLRRARPARVPNVPRWVLLTILLLAFALRAHHLAFQSLWSDEGISVQRAALPLRAMLATMPVEHAPGYFVLLRGWIALAGTTDYALRFLSLWPSVLAVALLHRLSSDLAAPASVRRWIGLLAPALLATNAFQVAYAQEARMYAWLLACSLAATLALWWLLHVSARRGVYGWGALYAVATAACVYLHYFGALVPVAHAFFVAGWVIATRRWRPAARWALAAAGALLLFAPWLGRALGVFGFSGWRAGGSVAEIPWRYLAAYAGGPMPAPWDLVIPWLALGLALLGAAWWVGVRPAGGWLLVAITLLPFAAVLGLALRNPDYHERYTIFLSAPLLALVAAGTIALEPRIWRADPRTRPGGLPVATAAVAAVLLGANMAALANYYTNAALHKPDYRAAAARIQAQQRPGDLILVDGPNPALVFAHYYTGGLPVVDLRDLAGATAEAVDARLRAATAGAARVWELLYFHDPGPVQVWLATRAYATEPAGYNGIRLTLYGLDEAGADAQVIAPNLAYGDALTLTQATLAPARLASGDVLRVATDWQTRATPPDWKFSLRLLDGAGSVAQAVDYVPQNWFAPTPIWAVGQAARDQRGLLTDALATGTYTVTLRLYDAATGAPVATAQGDDAVLGTVTVQSANAPQGAGEVQP